MVCQAGGERDDDWRKAVLRRNYDKWEKAIGLPRGAEIRTANGGQSKTSLSRTWTRKAAQE